MLVGSTFDDAAVCCAVRCALAVLCSPPCQATAEKARPSANSSTACSAHLPLPAHVALPCAALTRPAPAHPLQAEVPVEVIVILPSLALDFLLSDGWPAIPPILASELHISLVALPASYPLVTIVPVFTTTTTTTIVATASLRRSVLDAARSSRLVTEYQRIIPTPPSNHSTVALSPSWFSEAFASDSVRTICSHCSRAQCCDLCSSGICTRVCEHPTRTRRWASSRLVRPVAADALHAWLQLGARPAAVYRAQGKDLHKPHGGLRVKIGAGNVPLAHTGRPPRVLRLRVLALHTCLP